MNWQNIPQDTDVVTRALRPKRGALSLIDYSQIEPRLFAYFCAKGLRDTTIAEWYQEGRDVYVEIAARAYGKAPAEVTKEQRTNGKVWFLMSLYGAGPRKVAQELGIPEREAKQFYRDFHAGIPQIKALSNPRPKSGHAERWEPGELERVLQRRGFLRTPWGRHLHPEQYGEYKILNKLIQGSAADLMKASLVRIHDWIYAEGLETQMISVIHDEIIFDGPVSEVEILHEHVPALMREERIHEVVPIEVDHEVSTETWADKEDYETWAMTRSADGAAAPAGTTR